MVDKTVVADGGFLFRAAQGISILQADSVIVERNDIHDFHFNGIGIGYSMGYCASGSGNHSVRFNHVWNIGNDLDEVNCIYNLGESHGTIIDSNLCHDDPPCFLIDNVLGASAGALVAAALLVDHSPEALKLKFLDVAKDVKSMTFGPFNPRFNVNKLFRDELNKV
jgi:hypothetical protein